MLADISIGVGNGARAVLYLNRQLQALPPLRALILAVKAFLRHHQSNEVAAPPPEMLSQLRQACASECCGSGNYIPPACAALLETCGIAAVVDERHIVQRTTAMPTSDMVLCCSMPTRVLVGHSNRCAMLT